MHFSHQPVSARLSQHCTTTHGDGTLVLQLLATPHLSAACATQLEILVDWESPAASPLEVGYIDAWLVDKTVTGPNSKPNWVNKLARGKGDDDLASVRDGLQSLYNVFGGYQKQFKAIRSDLSADNLIWLDKILIYEEFRGIGLGYHTLSSFHQLMESLMADRGVTSGTIVLQADVLDSRDPDDEIPGQMRVDTQRKLRAFYGSHEYSVWYREEPDLAETDGTYTLMGRKLVASTDNIDGSVPREPIIDDAGKMAAATIPSELSRAILV